MATGDLCYFVIPGVDSGRTRQFYGAVLGWTFTEGNVPDGWNIEGGTPPGGVAGGSADPAITTYFTVDDIEAACARVRDAGGKAAEPKQAGPGRFADCADDQGIAFGLFEFDGS